jgi:DEAD/DEAH box helicase domain-containing protein
MRRITFDIETEGELRGGDFSNLEITVVGVYDSETKKLQGFYKEDFHLMWPLFESADMLVGYNSDHFDIPILNKYYAGDLTKFKSLDILKEIKNVLGRRLKLDSIAEATLGKKKTGNGLEAIGWWKEGLKEKVMQYCLDDVAITDEVYRYALKHKKLKYMDYEGVRDIKLDVSTWEAPSDSPAITHTLPF